MPKKLMKRGSTSTSIGPTSWLNDTVSAIEESEQLVRRATRTVEKSRAKDAPANLRGVVTDMGNEEARKHCRQVREVARRLTETLIDANEEVKALKRCRESMERERESLQKDLRVNGVSRELRMKRPGKEKASDGADGLLDAERAHLKNLCDAVDVELQHVQKQLQKLDSARSRLIAVSQERSRVLELLPNTVRGGGGTRRRSKENDAAMVPDPVGPFTPEAEEALRDAKDAIGESKDLRRKMDQQLPAVGESQKTVLKTVNDLLDRKITETNNLKKQLANAFEENRVATNKAQKNFDTTELAWLQLRGPVSSGNVVVREKLDRPIVKVFQRHTGTDLLEAHEIVKGTDGLLNSLHSTGQNIGMLKLSQLRLQQDMENKKAALNADKQVVNIRRRKVAE